MVHKTPAGARTARGLSPGVLPGARSRAQNAFTVIELMLAVAIVGVLSVIVVPGYQDYRDRVRIAQAKADVVAIESALARYYADNLRFPDTLAQAGVGGMCDPWGNPYRYLNIAAAKSPGQVRKDHKLVPINSDYDLYSMGKDGASQPPLTAKTSRDDVIRANNGQFVGLAAEY
jgi:general secretion pathway protein G